MIPVSPCIATTLPALGSVRPDFVSLARNTVFGAKLLPHNVVRAGSVPVAQCAWEHAPGQVPTQHAQPSKHAPATDFALLARNTVFGVKLPPHNVVRTGSVPVVQCAWEHAPGQVPTQHAQPSKHAPATDMDETVRHAIWAGGERAVRAVCGEALHPGPGPRPLRSPPAANTSPDNIPAGTYNLGDVYQGGPRVLVSADVLAILWRHRYEPDGQATHESLATKLGQLEPKLLTGDWEVRLAKLGTTHVLVAVDTSTDCCIAPAELVRRFCGPVWNDAFSSDLATDSDYACSLWRQEPPRDPAAPCWLNPPWRGEFTGSWARYLEDMTQPVVLCVALGPDTGARPTEDALRRTLLSQQLLQCGSQTKRAHIARARVVHLMHPTFRRSQKTGSVGPLPVYEVGPMANPHANWVAVCEYDNTYTPGRMPQVVLPPAPSLRMEPRHSPLVLVNEGPKHDYVLVSTRLSFRSTQHDALRAACGAPLDSTTTVLRGLGMSGAAPTSFTRMGATKHIAAFTVTLRQRTAERMADGLARERAEAADDKMTSLTRTPSLREWDPAAPSSYMVESLPPRRMDAVRKAAPLSTMAPEIATALTGSADALGLRVLGPVTCFAVLIHSTGEPTVLATALWDLGKYRLTPLDGFQRTSAGLQATMHQDSKRLCVTGHRVWRCRAW